MFQFGGSHIIVPAALARPLPAPGLAVKGKASGPQRCSVLGCQRIGDDSLIAHLKPNAAAGPVELGTGVVRPVRTAAQDFQGQPIIQIPGNGTATNGDAAQVVPVITGHGELTAYGRDAVPVIPAHILPRGPQVAGLDFQWHFHPSIQRGGQASSPSPSGSYPVHGLALFLLGLGI